MNLKFQGLLRLHYVENVALKRLRCGISILVGFGYRIHECLTKLLEGFHYALYDANVCYSTSAKNLKIVSSRYHEYTFH